MGPKKGDITLKDALGTMLSGGQKNRIDGVSRSSCTTRKRIRADFLELKEIFRHNQKSPNLDVLDDGGYHSIFEALFQVAQAEKQAYLAAKNPGQKTKAERALTACSDVLRITIRAGADKLNYKTVQAVIEHVTQLLPIATGEYCAGLSQFYLKTLGSLFEHEAHVEHLKDEDWLSIVDFCLQGIGKYNLESSSETIASSRAFSGSMATTSSSAHTSNTKLSVRTLSDGNVTSSVTRRNSEELLHCLIQLISPSNAPVHERAEPIFHSIMHFLNSHGSFVSSVHQVAFSGLNSMLAATTADRTDLSRSLAFHLIPIISHLWSLKLASKDEMLNSVKDEMLITILLLRLPIEHIFDSPDVIDFRHKIENLEAVLRMEYMKRLQPDQLQLDDLDMSTSVEDTSLGTSIYAGILRLRSSSPRAERNWAILTVLSIFDGLLHTVHDRFASNIDDSNEDTESLTHPRKRRRVAQRFDSFVTRLASQDDGEQTVALQTLFFLLPESELSQHDLDDLLEHLTSRVVDRQRHIGSWAMLCIASCTHQNLARDNSCSFDWTKLWHIVSRMITTAATCRAACYLLHSMMANGLVSYRKIAEEMDAIVIVPETSAPAILTDSSLSLMAHLLSLRNAEAPGGSVTAGHHVIRWISARWNPVDKLFAARCAVDVHPIDILNLFRTGLGLSNLRLSAKGHAPRGIIGQSWIQDLQKESMIRYLLLLKNLPKRIGTCSKCSSVSSLYALDRLSDTSAHGQAIRRLILELFLPKFQLLLEDLVPHSVEESSQVSTDTIRCTASTHIFGCLVLSLVTDSGFQELQVQLKNILRGLEEFIFAQIREVGHTQDLIESIIQAIQPYIPTTISVELTHLAQNSPMLANFFTLMADHPSLRHSASADVLAPGIDDPMDLDIFDSQRSRSKGAESRDSLARQDLAMALSPAAFYDTTAARLILMASIFKTDNNIKRIPTGFVDYITHLKPTETLLCRNMLRDTLRADFTLDREDASRLIYHIADILASPNYACCEVAQGLCLDTLTNLASAWINSAEGLSEVATELYEWFVGKVLPKRRPSSNVQVGLADLCYEIMRLQPAYGEGLQLPSTRSCLFDILQKGPMCVKFHIANQLPNLFGLYILKRHSDILTDVLESLPSDPDWAEGIAFRLQVLGALASKWPTLIRLCTYYILEVPGQLAGSIKHATCSLAEVSRALGLRNVQDLFRLFASQLLYTWLATEQLDKIPYQIFGYANLQDLVRDNQEETTALMIMRNQDGGVADLVQILGIPVQQLLQEGFSKVIAYSVGHDISVPQSTNTKKYVSGEARVRKLLGKEVFFDLVNKHFADIIALFFTLIDQEEHIVEKSFVKNPRLAYATEAMNRIRSMSFSEVALPPSQQPAFKSKYLTSEIEHLCGRTEHEIGALYTPSMTVFVARHILETIHPALGSLHACAVLRKLRVLMALSGPASLEGYPLEMLLQAIKPFITDPECANDAIGLTQYLLAQGSLYLSTTPTFVASISLTILASLRAFLESSPASTTQQSQHRSTLSKAQTFHMWLGSYLAEYDPPMLDEDHKAALRAIFKSAHAFRSGGNADIGTAESDLLLELLQDDRSGRRLVNKPSRNLAVSLLYGNFRQPTSFRHDVLGLDDHAVAYTATVWNLCQEAPISRPLLIWAAKVLGRSFAATGDIHQEFLQESGLKRMIDITKSLPRQKSSKACILHLLRVLTLGDEPRTVGLIEAVLRLIVTRPDVPLESTEGIAGDESFSEILSESLFRASDWAPYQVPPSDSIISKTNVPNDPFGIDAILENYWPRRLAIALVQSVPSDAVLSALQLPLQNIDGFAEQAFPFIVHLVLSLQMEGHQVAGRRLSKALKSWLERKDIPDAAHIKLLISTLLYLRTQLLPRESSSADRMHWLEVDYASAAEAAVRCGMFKTALLFIEISVSETTRSSRRSSTSKFAEPQDILLSIFKNIDDPDIFYGLRQSASLGTVLDRLEYENDGLKSLAFRGAQYDVNLRRLSKSSTSDAQALVNALGMLSLDGLSHSLLQSQQNISMYTGSVKRMFQTARKLEQWDLPIPATCDNEAVTLYKTFQAVNLAEDRKSISHAIEEGLGSTMLALLQATNRAGSIHTSLQTLATLTEIDEVLGASSSEQFEEILERFQNRAHWMETGRFDDVNHIMSCRETILSCLSQQIRLRNIVNISAPDGRLVEVQTTLLSSRLSRAHGALQESLTSATYLASLIEPCLALGLNIEAAAHLEAANALWEQGEMTSSIGMLQALEKNTTFKKQTIPVGKSDLLAKIGYQVSVARLEKPDRIVEKYLLPALKELKGKVDGSEAGQVFHEFAVFCDHQLQDADSLEDLVRLKRLKEMKASEVHDLGRMVKSATSSEQKAKYHAHLVKAKQWLQLDSEEYRRLSSSKDELLRQSLENYLLSLTASDGHNNDALRFTALWLEHSEEEIAIEPVSKHLSKVPTRKFASLMNQLTSRLLDNSDKFQQLLFSLVLRICVDHPYHGMYQIWAGFKSRSNTKDETAVSRQAATNKVAQQVATISRSAKIWSAINRTNSIYCQLASERDEPRYKAGQKIQLKDSQAGSLLNSMLPRFPIPPPTLQVSIMVDLDYSSVPIMCSLEPQIVIASGVSAPKIITVIASDGSRFKQLVKGGNDDLRQDAIMEQVFSQVSELLRTNTSTRQRDLGIRTYKVLPLSSNAGIIEFVSNTIPLHEFLMPAHERYYPKDLKGSQCRKQIGDVQTQKLDVRINTYRTVTEQFHPVMRYFFMEKFYDPDDWFARRLAYTRSTAAISILGHVLGLGDRHGHNILLDDKTGEVVHIDLGVAFEMGRVLPVPELVPFRLTRDIVDGMGITKTEGVYRRCCEFTLEALRKESYSIMMILDVLRYDPLYSWSISPVRLAKLQNAQSAVPALSTAGDAAGGRSKIKEVVNEPSEADRALTVVKKKLSKTLSVTATVNDLINQATDERNLAVLYSGWAAYA